MTGSRPRFALHPVIEKLLRGYQQDHSHVVAQVREELQRGHGGTAGSLWAYTPAEQLQEVERRLQQAVVLDDHQGALLRQPWYIRWGFRPLAPPSLTPGAQRDLQDLAQRCQKAHRVIDPLPPDPPDGLQLTAAGAHKINKGPEGPWKTPTVRSSEPTQNPGLRSGARVSASGEGI